MLRTRRWSAVLAALASSGIALAVTGLGFGQQVIGDPDYSDACRHAPAGAACAAQRDRAAAAYVEMDAALADPQNCERLKAARDRFERGLDGWMKLEGARIRCELEAAKKDLAALQQPDPASGPGGTKVFDQSASGRPVQNAAQPDPFASPAPARSRPAQAAGRQDPFVSAQPPAPAQTAQRPDPFANYRSHDRDSASVDVNVRRPDEPWDMVRDGVDIGVTRLGDAFDAGDSSQRLQLASAELEQQRLLREMREREAARQAEQERRDAALQAQLAQIQRDEDRARKRAEDEAEARQNAQLLNFGLGLLNAYNNSKGYGPPPGSTYVPSTGLFPGSGAGQSSTGQFASDPQRASCDRQIAAATSRLSNPQLGAGMCQSARDAVRLYSEIERAYAGCQQYYAADYQATVSARRSAEQMANATCSNGGASTGGSSSASCIPCREWSSDGVCVSPLYATASICPRR